MLARYRYQGGRLEPVGEFGPNTLVTLIDPSEAELRRVADACGDIDMDDLRSALDDEETARVESDERYSLLVFDAPLPRRRADSVGYRTYPLAVIATPANLVITISRVDFKLPSLWSMDFRRIPPRGGSPRFVLNILLTVAVLYQRYLREIESRRAAMVARLDNRATNADLMVLHGLETDIVYFETSLNAARTALGRVPRMTPLVDGEADRDLFDDILVEIDQAREMAGIYERLINSSRELFTGVMDNDLNATMRLLASITLIVEIPTIVSGLYGMNVEPESVPFAESPIGFGIVLAATLALCVLAAIFLHRRHLL